MSITSSRKPLSPPTQPAHEAAPAAARVPQPLDPKLLGAIGGGRKAPSLDLPKGTWR
jgi:hypothetical protein